MPKIGFQLTMRREGWTGPQVPATTFFEIDVNWLALAPNHVQHMEGFKPDTLCDFMLTFEDGSAWRFVPLNVPNPQTHPKDFVEWLQHYMVPITEE